MPTPLRGEGMPPVESRQIDVESLKGQSGTMQSALAAQEAMPASFRPRLEEATTWADLRFADRNRANLKYSLSLRVEDPPRRERVSEPPLPPS
jgi:hypothetical protein